MNPTPTHWDEEIAVLIIGSGFAGFAAAAEAAGLGAQTVILEKMPYYGGNSILSGGGYSAWDNSDHLRQRLGLGEDSWELHQDDTLKGGDYFNLPDLVEVMVKGAPECLDWLREAGMELRETLPRIGGHSAHRSFVEAKASGRGMINPMKKLALEQGAELRLNQPVSGIWREASGGPVLGVEVTSAAEKKNIKISKALIVASGGFGQDIPMRTAFNPNLDSAYNCSNHRGATGEVIRYAQAIGADVLHLAFIQLYPCAEPKHGAADAWALHPYSGTGYGLIYVERHGKRFVNELARRDVVSQAQIIAGQKPTYAILNAEIFHKLATPATEISQSSRRLPIS
ncbi:MAG: FAD-dependent oxidoreductase [Peptococcaceae bacterium]|jgi:fumarate reductase flavoprotein subunit|nr:FAD-dependent oxidoreductase [Peptococcaceae bacterium]